jgi:hypothetical protein|tara:strand:- start:1176 stop:1565 length:390 start_codon:yes stop_codon:yes gene_type:complete
MLGLDKLIAPVAGILDKFVVDKDLKMKLQHELETALHSANLAQLEVNKAEAAHKSIFVAGWRPFVGWVCGVALAYHFILAPLLQFGFALGGVEQDLPEFEFGQLSTVLMGMLGLGGLRTFEKMKGVSRE